MSRSSRRAASAALFVGLTNAIALSDFTPALTNVPDPCDSVYMQDISGCSASDFSSSAGCSESCISGLVAVNQALDVACQDFSAPSGSLISFFQQGEGIQLLCKIAVVTASAPPPSAPSAPSSSVIPMIGPGTMTLPSTSMASQSSILVDTSSAPLPAASTRISTTSASSSPTSTGILTASGSPPVQTTLSTATTLPPQVTSLSSSLSSQSTSTTSTTTKTSSAAAAQSDTDGNDGSGGDPFAPSAGAISSPSLALLLIGTILGASILI